MMCRVLKVSRSSYYYWLKEPRSQRKEHVKILKDKIQTVYFKAKGRYGSPRIKEELCRTGTAVSRPTVAKYMKQMGLKSKLARKFRVTTDSNHKEPVADNILNQDFFSFSPLKKCVSDITYIPTKNGFLYLTIVMDLFNRDIIGWNLSSNMTTKDTVLAAINKAAMQYSFEDGMVFHSDRGAQYASKTTRSTLKSYNIVQRVSRARNCWDNAVAESFFKSLKTELIYGTKLMGAKQMKNRIFEYIEIWYRKQRRHSYLDYQTIEEFNNQYRKQNMNNVA
jgi:putative transposase